MREKMRGKMHFMGPGTIVKGKVLSGSPKSHAFSKGPNFSN